ncbi:MAG: hypothetical protein R2799_01250 [Crocinitomicaceae bacterium]
MKTFRNIFVIVFALGLVASCSKEVIVPQGAIEGHSTKKNGSAQGETNTNNSVNLNDIEEGEVNISGQNDGEITDPENDLDFD